VNVCAPSNVPASGGASVTLGGLNYGATDPTATVSMSSAACSSTAWTCATAVTCRAPLGARSSNALAVSVSRSVGTVLGAFSFDGTTSLRHRHPSPSLLI
jgi:hypothetical protein